jgi:catechol 2,3-dioxygenase
MATSTSILAKNLQIKPSQLYVKDLQKVTKYYRDIVGLASLTATDSHVVLGHDETPVLELISKPEYRNASLKTAGLFHNAIVFHSRAALAEAVFNILQKAPWSFEGSADHLVSEAFYFHDPENNGLELYYDRPRESWEWANGSVRMDTLYLDPRSFIAANIHGTAEADKELGHVHLRVGDVPTARKFYVEQLGFDATADMGSALFVSVGGYHHHMAMNTWLSAGASKRDPSLGLGEVKLVLPDDGSIDKLANRLKDHKLPFVQKQDKLLVNDPWNNQLVFTSE